MTANSIPGTAQARNWLECALMGEVVGSKSDDRFRLQAVTN